MKFYRLLLTAGLALALAACTNNEVKDELKGNKNPTSEDKKVTNDQSALETIKVRDRHGDVEVIKNPQKVVALDSRTFDVLEKMGVKLLAAPKDVMDQESYYVADEKVENLGNHREPNLELLAAMDPELVIVGQRFQSYYDQIKELLPNASVIDIDIDVSENSKSPGENLKDGLINSTTILGEIFDKEDIAKDLIEEFNKSIDDAKSSYKGDRTMGVIVSGGNIGYSSTKYGRVWGPIFEILELNPALTVKNDSSQHKGDDISVEAIAESKPSYLLVLDRDAAVSSIEDKKPAKDVLENSLALKDLAAIKDEKIYYAPNNTYTNESIITYTKIFNGLGELFEK